MEQQNVFYATGKRKMAVARTWLKPGKGEIIINNKPVEEFFAQDAARQMLMQPFELTNTTGEYDIKVAAAAPWARPVPSGTESPRRFSSPTRISGRC